MSTTRGGDSRTAPTWRPRLAATLALCTPVAAAALVIAALARGDVAIAILALALVLLASAALWVALTNRGGRRTAGAIVAALAAAGLLATLIVNWQGVLVLVAVFALLALFGASARYALGRTGQAAGRRVDATVTRVAAVEGAALIINPKSGGGKAERFALAERARERGIEPILLVPGDDLLALAEGAIGRGARAIGMAGGDGSQALVASVAARLDVPHVCIPAGTRNHFALDLGLDRDDVLGALDAFSDGRERRIDLAEVNGRVFVNNASLGVYAKVVQSSAYRDAKLDTWVQMLPELLGPDAEPIDLKFVGPDGEQDDRAVLVLVSNNPYQLTQLAGAGTRERIDLGTLGVFAAHVNGPGDVSRLVALELAGAPARFPGLESWSTPSFEVRSGGPVEVGLDGEALVLEPPLRFISRPGALRVLLPQGATLAPAARAVSLTRGSLGELVKVAAGR
jgi:diacylglycerol kinase family enzyme